MAVNYRDNTPFEGDNHTVGELAQAIRTKMYGVDVREPIAQAVEKMEKWAKGENIGSIVATPTEVYASLDELRAKYPNGADGVFLTADNGHKYFWINGIWTDGGAYQNLVAEPTTAEVEDGRVWFNGQTSDDIGGAIRGQALFLNSKLDDEVKNRVAKDIFLEDKINILDTAVEAKTVNFIDNDGNFLEEGLNNFLGGKVYLPKTDYTGESDGIGVDSSVVGKTFLMNLRNFGIPVLELSHPNILDLKSKADGKIENVEAKYNGLEITLKSIAIQGQSSQQWPKKNYTIKFDTPTTLLSSWGASDKYVLKADYTDFSHQRYEAAAEIWSRIRKNRIGFNSLKFSDTNGNLLVNNSDDVFVGETSEQFATLAAGAPVMTPIFVIINGKYHGLYRLMLKEGMQISGMAYGNHEAILSASDRRGGATGFKAHTDVDDDGNIGGTQWEIAYASDEDNTKWLADKFNAAVDVLNAQGSTTAEVAEQFDLGSVIDYLIFSVIISNSDGIGKNLCLNTYHQNSPFVISAYDLDSTFGNDWHGLPTFDANDFSLNYIIFQDNLAKFVWEKMHDEVVERYNSLRNSVLSEDVLYMLVDQKGAMLSKSALDYEAKLWPSTPSTNVYNANQLKQRIHFQLAEADKQFI